MPIMTVLLEQPWMALLGILGMEAVSYLLLFYVFMV